MDDFDESLEIETENGRGGKAGVIGIWIGIVGIIVGITGIFLANQAQSKIRALEAKFSTTPDQASEFTSAVDDLDRRLVKLGGEFVKLGRQDRQLQENTQSAFDMVTKDIRANRDGVNELTEKLTILVGQLESGRPVRMPVITTTEKVQPSEVVEDSPSSGAGSGAGGEFHIVASGDTLSQIAKKYGVSLGNLQQANPSIDPRALQIGQRVIIPGR